MGPISDLKFGPKYGHFMDPKLARFNTKMGPGFGNIWRSGRPTMAKLVARAAVQGATLYNAGA